MKKLMVIMIAVLLTASALADQYVHSKPTNNQIQKEQAIQIGAEFLAETFGFDAAEQTASYRREEVFFGPGYQWSGDTGDDCWIIPFSGGEHGSHQGASVLINGNSGEIEYWECRTVDPDITYISRIPDEDELTYENVNALLMDYIMADWMLESGEIPQDINSWCTYGIPWASQAKNMPAAYYERFAPEFDLYRPMWEVFGQRGKMYERLESTVLVIDAWSGQVLKHSHTIYDYPTESYLVNEEESWKLSPAE